MTIQFSKIKKNLETIFHKKKKRYLKGKNLMIKLFIMRILMMIIAHPKLYKLL